MAAYHNKMAYKEPAPIKDKENPFESMMSRFNIAAEALGLDDETYEVLKSPTRQVIVHLPVLPKPVNGKVGNDELMIYRNA